MANNLSPINLNIPIKNVSYINYILNKIENIEFKHIILELYIKSENESNDLINNIDILFDNMCEHKLNIIKSSILKNKFKFFDDNIVKFIYNIDPDIFLNLYEESIMNNDKEFLYFFDKKISYLYNKSILNNIKKYIDYKGE